MSGMAILDKGTFETVDGYRSIDLYKVAMAICEAPLGTWFCLDIEDTLAVKNDNLITHGAMVYDSMVHTEEWLNTFSLVDGLVVVIRALLTRKGELPRPALVTTRSLQFATELIAVLQRAVPTLPADFFLLVSTANSDHGTKGDNMAHLLQTSGDYASVRTLVFVDDSSGHLDSVTHALSQLPQPPHLELFTTDVFAAMAESNGITDRTLVGQQNTNARFGE